MGKHFPFLSLSLSLQNLLCNLPQRKVVSTQLQTGYNGSQRVTTGPNGLKRVPSQRVPTGLTGGGGERKGQWHVYYLPTIILFISFIHKNFISLFIFLLSLSPIIHENIYIYKKIIVIHIYLFIYNINIHKTYFYPKNFATFNLFLILLLLKFLVLL